jgi:ribosome-binding factor A
MTSRRVLKVAEAIRQVVSMAIVTELRDPRIENVTVTYVEVSSDLRNAKVHVSVMGDQTRQELALKGLRNAAGFLQQKVGRRVDTRYTPRLRFELDQGVKRSIEVARILDELLPENEAATDDTAAQDPNAGPPADGSSSDDRPLDDRMAQDPATEVDAASELDEPTDPDGSSREI